MNINGWFTTLSLFFVITGCSSSPEHSSLEHKASEQTPFDSIAVAEATVTKMVDIVNTNGEKIGTATLKEEKNGVQLLIEVSKLEPGKHGFHIHQKSFEGTDFESAGSHLNPLQKEHGLKNPKGPHLGDMHNLVVKQDGTAVQKEFIEKATLREGHPYSLLGTSIMIHEKEDDQVTDPSGNSGNRVAGGSIK